MGKLEIEEHQGCDKEKKETEVMAGEDKKITPNKTQKKAWTEEELVAECVRRYEELSVIQRALISGIAGDTDCSIIPSLLQSDVETVFPQDPKTNANIVVGKDRPASRFSGKGSDTGAAAIDIVVGRMGDQIVEGAKVDPDFVRDAARIYLSQKTDVDVNLGVVAGSTGLSNNKSAIAIKADSVVVVGREKIKFVTGTDAKNSQGADIRSIGGIELIAGNQDTEPEAMVLGTKLTNALGRFADHVTDLNGIVKHALTVQMDFNSAVQNHFHYSPWYGNPTQPSDACMAKGAKTSMDHLQESQRSLTSNQSNIASWKQNNLCESGRDFINSRWNKLN